MPKPVTPCLYCGKARNYQSPRVPCPTLGGTAPVCSDECGKRYVRFRLAMKHHRGPGQPSPEAFAAADAELASMEASAC